MPYSRDQVVAGMLSLYKFLVRMYLPDDALRRPPPGGWPWITPERFAYLDKNDTVIDLMKHLPYIRRDDRGKDPLPVYDHCLVNDFADGAVETWGVEKGYSWETEPWPGYVGEGVLAEEVAGVDAGPEAIPGPHVITLCRSLNAKGYHILLNTDTGFVYMMSESGDERVYEGITQFVQAMQEECSTLEVIPEEPTPVRRFFRCERHETLKWIFHECGWPSDDFRKQNVGGALRSCLMGDGEWRSPGHSIGRKW